MKQPTGRHAATPRTLRADLSALTAWARDEHRAPVLAGLAAAPLVTVALVLLITLAGA